MSVAVTEVVVRVVCVAPAVQRTCEAWVGSEEVRKLVPVRSSVKLALAQSDPHDAMLVGASALSVGTGLGGGLITKMTGLESPLLPAPENGFWVITVAVPGLATSAAGTAAVTDSTTVMVESSVTVVTSFFPFQVT